MSRFALTVFLSSFLLFQVQPMLGRYILPWFGGGPAVWTACLFFFRPLCWRDMPTRTWYRHACRSDANT